MRYYFDVRDDFYSAEDEKGEELADVDAARREAVRVATSIAGDVFGADGSSITVRVRDQVQPLFELRVSLSRRELP